MLIAGETGLLVPIRSPREIVSAVESFIGDVSLRRRLGQSASSVARLRHLPGIERRNQSSARMNLSVNGTADRTTYDTWHARLEVDRDADAPWHRLLLQHLEPAHDLEGRTVLEVACGRGGLACRIASSAYRPSTLIAADFSTAALGKGRQFGLAQNIRNVRWSASDLQRLAFRTAAFDTVISCESIEHIARPQDACAEFARVLKTGGRFVP